ncbi:hypothetical protein ACFS7Z_05630 [Pontibacter toksunensis]|uniref:Uncharacterized protein n=1 Tax=Pontibacter toksunensis TaxID=1332631 RepID=A0ABW6BRD4_9BACT
MEALHAAWNKEAVLRNQINDYFCSFYLQTLSGLKAESVITSIIQRLSFRIKFITYTEALNSKGIML